jgi:hypothetical protein
MIYYYTGQTTFIITSKDYGLHARLQLCVCVCVCVCVIIAWARCPHGVARLAQFQKSAFFKIWLASQNSFGFLAFLHTKIIWTKITYNLFSKPFFFKKNMFWSITFGSISAAQSLGKRAPASDYLPPTGKSIEYGGYVTRRATVATMRSVLSMCNNVLRWNCDTSGCFYKPFIINSHGHVVKQMVGFLR